jgi:hypothetical protein
LLGSLAIALIGFISLAMFSKGTRRALLAAMALTASTVGTLHAAASPDLLDETHASVRAVRALQDKVTRDLMKLENVLGTAIGVDDDGAASLVVYVEKGGRKTPELLNTIPPAMNGIPVKVEETEQFRAFVRPPNKGGGGGGGTTSSGPGTPHTAAQSFPIQLGTSGGWRSDLANGYCCGGTLGSLVQVNGVQYILSNYHVFESDIVLGGNNTIATTGSPVIQPGLIDVGCNANNAQNVGTLQVVHSLPNNNVDVGLAQANAGAVRTDGSILEIGTISHTPVGPALNQPVKKSGRTTGLTHSAISGLNATISVTYENECAGGTAFTKTFTGQIVIANSNSGFLNSGDSGSLLVEDVATNPRPVGLLYAGSSSTAIANPIGEVLNFVGAQLGGTATMVGN